MGGLVEVGGRRRGRRRQVEAERAAPRAARQPRRRLGERRLVDEEGRSRLACDERGGAPRASAGTAGSWSRRRPRSRRGRRAAGRGPRRASGRGRSASRSSGRRRPTSSPSATPASTRIVGRRSRSSRPACGRNVAGPRRRDAPRRHAFGGSGAPAVQSARRGRSGAAPGRGRRPGRASVTGCSTWIRPLSSRKKEPSGASMNSAVPALR